MNKFFDKSKIYNYIAAGIFLITALVFIKNISLFVWHFDIFNGHQVFTFLKHIASGKSFSSGKQLSFLMTFIGSLFVTLSGVLIAMELKFIKPQENSENTSNSDTEQNKATKVIKASEKSKENTEEKTEEKAKENTDMPKSEEKFAMYNNANKSEPVAKKQEVIIEEKPEIIENSKNEDEERAKLQAKIKEIMKKMKEKQETEELEEINKNPSEKLLSKVEFQKNSKTELIDMNFKNISEKENLQMEHTLISAGFKLLSEIRIGSTGIDYLGVAKDKLVVVQLDTTDGNWFASEDTVEGNKSPVWFSENGNKTSPVSRTLEAKSNIEKLLAGNIDLPIETVACLTNSNVVNYEEFKEKWDEMGVKVVKLNESEEDSISDIKTLSDIYPIHSQEEISEEAMNKIISILEKAEIPE